MNLGIIILVIVLIAIFVVAFLIALIILFRNTATYKYRVGLIKRDFEAYEKLPSYNRMMFHYKPFKDKYWLK